MDLSHQRWTTAFLLLLWYTTGTTLAQQEGGGGDEECKSRRFEGCDRCVAGGQCGWCQQYAYCADASYIGQANTLECDFTATCGIPDEDKVFFTDPLAASQKWVYDLINVEPVWRAGYTGKGIGIRINDDGVDANHVEFAGRFDVASSCSVHDPADATETHGTFVAGLAAAGGNNGECAVGVAPLATLSACRVVNGIIGDYNLADEELEFEYFYLDMENMDISQNSYGVSGCEAFQARLRRRQRQRQLQNGGTTMCPFQSVAGSPCETCAATTTAVIDWSAPGAACQPLIAEYCTGASLEVNDVEACYAYLTLFAKCQYTSTTPTEEKALRRGIEYGRDGKGIIYVFASGNDREYGADVNMEGVLTSRYTISVGGVMRDGTHTPFSVGGTALFVVAPAGSLFDTLNTISSLPGDGCGDEGPGTSFSAPLVAGVIALVLEANPVLTWRDVQGILATTSRQTDPDDPSWTINAAGLRHSDLYGFGIVDAERAVAAAKQWTTYTPEWELEYDATNNVNIAIPQSPMGPVTSTIQVTTPAATFVVESVEVFIDVDHGTRGDLEIILTSPRGTKSVLHPGRRPENSQLRAQWKMMTVKHWGENPSGAWTLTVVDTVTGDLKECIDYEWALPVRDGSGEFWTCNDVSPGSIYGEICVDGKMGPDFGVSFAIADGLDDAVLKDDQGITPAVGCCACGGGRMSSNVTGKLVAWSLAVHGHDPENQQGPSTTGTDVSAGSSSSIVLSVMAMLAAMPWLAMVQPWL